MLGNEPFIDSDSTPPGPVKKGFELFTLGTFVPKIDHGTSHASPNVRVFAQRPCVQEMTIPVERAWHLGSTRLRPSGQAAVFLVWSQGVRGSLETWSAGFQEH